jgi:hypothetical protein
MTDRPDLAGTPWAVLYQSRAPQASQRQGRNLGTTQQPGAQIHDWTLQEYFPSTPGDRRPCQVEVRLYLRRRPPGPVRELGQRR